MTRSWLDEAQEFYLERYHSVGKRFEGRDGKREGMEQENTVREQMLIKIFNIEVQETF